MNRRELLAATGALATTAVAGCQAISIGQTNSSGDSDVETVEQVEGGERRRVVVSATGEADGEPDLAVLSVGVEATGDAAGTVRNDLSTAAEDLREALLDAGLDEDDVTTSNYSIRDRLDRRAMEEDGVRPRSDDDLDEYRYYQGVHTYSVEVSEIDRVGEIIDVAVDAGADNVGRVTFTLSDGRRSDLRETALDRALETAREEAEHIASEVGASITEVTVVDAAEGHVDTVSREYLADAAATATPVAEGASTSVEPGDVTVTANVRVQYTIA
jgi:uncharacterized protein YggE